MKFNRGKKYSRKDRVFYVILFYYYYLDCLLSLSLSVLRRDMNTDLDKRKISEVSIYQFLDIIKLSFSFLISRRAFCEDKLSFPD